MDLEFSIDKALIKKIFTEKDDKTTLKSLNIFLNERDRQGESVGQQLLDIIARSNEEGGGAYEVDNLVITDIEFNYKSAKGNIYVNFSSSRYFGCSDINNSGYEEDDFGIAIDKINNKIHLNYFEAPEREPDTY